MRLTRIAFRGLAWLIFSALVWLGSSFAQAVPPLSSYGPYNGEFRPGGNGLTKPWNPRTQYCRQRRRGPYIAGFRVMDPNLFLRCSLALVALWKSIHDTWVFATAS